MFSHACKWFLIKFTLSLHREGYEEELPNSQMAGVVLILFRKVISCVLRTEFVSLFAIRSACLQYSNIVLSWEIAGSKWRITNINGYNTSRSEHNNVHKISSIVNEFPGLHKRTAYHIHSLQDMCISNHFSRFLFIL